VSTSVWPDDLEQLAGLGLPGQLHVRVLEDGHQRCNHCFISPSESHSVPAALALIKAQQRAVCVSTACDRSRGTVTPSQ
jgi:hypothetical protein